MQSRPQGMAVYVSICCLAVLLMLPSCGSNPYDSSGTGNTGRSLPDANDFDDTSSDSGSIGTGGWFNFEYYRHALPAQEMIEDGSIPDVEEDRGNLIVLNRYWLPSDWEIGSIIAVRMPDKTIEYKRILARFELEDGRVALGIVDAGVLEVIAHGEMDIDGDIGELGTASWNNYRRTSSKLTDGRARLMTDITIANFVDSRTFTIIDKSNIYPEALSTSGNYYGMSYDMKIGFPTVRIQAQPIITVKLVIDRKENLLDTWNNLTQAIQEVTDSIEDMSKYTGGTVGSGNTVYGVDAEMAETMMAFAIAAGDVAVRIDAVRQALQDKSRIAEGLAEIKGNLEGLIVLAAEANGSYHPDPVESPALASVLVPIAGPIPLFLEFSAKAVADFDFDATVRAETRAIATVPFYIGTRFDKGYLQLLNGDDLETTSIVFEDPSFDGTKGELLCSAGLQIEAGLNLAKLAEAHIDPTAKAVLNVNGTVSGDTTAGCANLNWDIYGELNAEAEVELTLPGISNPSKSWTTKSLYFRRGSDPKGEYEYCWGNYSLCGDGECGSNEDCETCPLDCGSCGPVCGDWSCDGTENCSSCPVDCGTCGPECGNGYCESGETCGNCSTDCGSCSVCGDGVCDPDEDEYSCYQDCDIAEVYNTITSTTQYITIEAWDCGMAEDGDTVNVILNGVQVKSNWVLEFSHDEHELYLVPGNNTVDIFAVNEGSSSPNTACFRVYDDYGSELMQAAWNMDTGQLSRLIVVYQP